METIDFVTVIILLDDGRYEKLSMPARELPDLALSIKQDGSKTINTKGSGKVQVVGFIVISEEVTERTFFYKNGSFVIENGASDE